MSMFKGLKEDMNKCFNKAHESKQLNELMKTIQDVKGDFNRETESLKTTRSTIKLEMKNSRHQTRIHEVSLTNRLKGIKKENLSP